MNPFIDPPERSFHDTALGEAVPNAMDPFADHPNRPFHSTALSQGSPNATCLDPFVDHPKPTAEATTTEAFGGMWKPTGELSLLQLTKPSNGSLNMQADGEYLALAQRNQHSSPLLRLPPEVRNHIYKYAMRGNKLRISSWKDCKPNNCTALLLVCRQTYSETWLMPFHLNIFEYDNATYFTAWLNALRPTQREGITKIHVALPARITVVHVSQLQYYRDSILDIPLHTLTGLKEFAVYGNQKRQSYHIAAMNFGGWEAAHRLKAQFMELERVHGLKTYWDVTFDGHKI